MLDVDNGFGSVITKLFESKLKYVTSIDPEAWFFNNLSYMRINMFHEGIENSLTSKVLYADYLDSFSSDNIAFLIGNVRDFRRKL